MKYVFFSIILLISLFVINNLIRSIVNISQKQELISSAQKQLAKEKKEHSALKKELESVNRQQFIEEQARNKLFMVKEGEQIVIIPHDEIFPKSTVLAKKEAEKTPLAQWYELFFKSTE